MKRCHWMSWKWPDWHHWTVDASVCLWNTVGWFSQKERWTSRSNRMCLLCMNNKQMFLFSSPRGTLLTAREALWKHSVLLPIQVKLKQNIWLRCSLAQLIGVANLISVCVLAVPQMHAQHRGWPIGACGGLPLWPRGDAPGSPREPTALSWGLCPQWLGPLEPLQPGESRGLNLQQIWEHQKCLTWLTRRFIWIARFSPRWEEAKCSSSVLPWVLCECLSTGCTDE